MKIKEVTEVVDGIPHMTVAEAETITNLIVENKFQNILELGFRFGVSTCYMAAALHEQGAGNITTIDLADAKMDSPNVEVLLRRLDLTDYVTVHYEPKSYIWRLMKLIEEHPEPVFDFCYLDGAHDWYTDGFAFFLVDKLLKPGGMIVLDDLDWTFGGSKSLKDSDRVQAMPEEERNTQQIRKVYELLVKTHPNYGDFKEDGHWAFATKKEVGSAAGQKIVEKETVVEIRHVGIGAFLEKLVRKLFG